MTFLLPISGRANWGSALPILKACERHGVPVQPVFYASALLPEFGNTARHLPNALRLPCQSSGDTAAAMSRTTAEATRQFADLFERERPRGVIIIGDRHEVLGPAIAAYQAGIPIHHTMGGERSGTIDDVTRDAITAMATEHYVATYVAAKRVARVTHGAGVHVTGCPRIDLVAEVVDPIPRGVGDHILVSLHPDTCMSYEENRRMANVVLEAALNVRDRIQCDRDDAGLCRTPNIHIIWPCADAHHEAIASEIRAFMHNHSDVAATHRTMDPESYYRMMATCYCMVGNSSSIVREAAYIGTQCVLVGDRQRGREKLDRIPWLQPGACSLQEFYAAMRLVGDYGRAPVCHLYGDGNASDRIAAIIKGCNDT